MKKGLIVILALSAVGAGIYWAYEELYRTAPPNFVDNPPIGTAFLSVEMEALTWTELRALVANGKTTAIVPTGGTEQNGPHMVLGKHNYIMRQTAARIAKTLGDAVVAPLIAYVPEGRIDPPGGHMAYHGTISIPESVFEDTLEATARSLRQHGFKTILLIGDSGGNQAALASVAEDLDDDWSGTGTRVLHVSDYYSANGQFDWLESEGESKGAIGFHAGIRDTSELLAVYPEGIRRDRMRAGNAPGLAASGVNGDPTRASAKRGEKLLQLKIDAALKQIRVFRAAAKSPG